MMPDDYTDYNDGSGFYDGDGYRVSQAEDEEDEEAEAEKVRQVLRQRDDQGNNICVPDTPCLIN